MEKCLEIIRLSATLALSYLAGQRMAYFLSNSYPLRGGVRVRGRRSLRTDVGSSGAPRVPLTLILSPEGRGKSPRHEDQHDA
jgi:hypothetical protein